MKSLPWVQPLKEPLLLGSLLLFSISVSILSIRPGQGRWKGTLDIPLCSVLLSILLTLRNGKKMSTNIKIPSYTQCELSASVCLWF